MLRKVRLCASLLVAFKICFCLFSCSQKNVHKYPQTVGKPIGKDSLLGNSNIYSEFKKLSAMLGIDSLDSGFDGEQIRIWFGYSSMDSSKLVVFSNVDSRWNGKLYAFKPVLNNNFDVIGLNKTFQVINPRSGWNLFEKKISVANIQSLRNYKDISEYDIGVATHCYAITIEWAQKDFHRILKYPCYEFYIDKIKEPSVLKEFAEYLEKDFSLKLLSPSTIALE